MSVIPLVDAKQHLNITSTSFDTELSTVLDAAESAVSKQVGNLAPAGMVEKVTASRGNLVLHYSPVAALTSVTDMAGNTLDLTDLVLLDSGIVTGVPDGLYTVAYDAGWSPLPGDIRQATLELLRHLWVTQRGGSTRPGSQPPEGLSNTLIGAAFSLPIRVTQLLAPYQVGGLA